MGIQRKSDGRRLEAAYIGSVMEFSPTFVIWLGVLQTSRTTYRPTALVLQLNTPQVGVAKKKKQNRPCTIHVNQFHPKFRRSIRVTILLHHPPMAPP